MAAPNPSVEEKVPPQVQIVRPEPEIPKTVDVTPPDPKAEENRVKQAEDDRLAKLQNKIGYLERRLEKEAHERAELAQSLQNLKFVPSNQVDQSQDTSLDPEVHRVMETNYQKGIELMIERRLAAEQVKQTETWKKQVSESELEKSRQIVRDRYPTIEDESSEEAKLLIEVINEDQSLRSNVHGPEIAMYRMEEKMRQRGIQPPYVKESVDKEVARQTRVKSVSTPPSRSSSDSDRLILTQDEKEICDRMKIPYARYAEMKKMEPSRFKEGVSVS